MANNFFKLTDLEKFASRYVSSDMEIQNFFSIFTATKEWRKRRLETISSPKMFQFCLLYAMIVYAAFWP